MFKRKEACLRDGVGGGSHLQDHIWMCLSGTLSTSRSPASGPSEFFCVFYQMSMAPPSFTEEHLSLSLYGGNPSFPTDHEASSIHVEC